MFNPGVVYSLADGSRHFRSCTRSREVSRYSACHAHFYILYFVLYILFFTYFILCIFPLCLYSIIFAQSMEWPDSHSTAGYIFYL